MEKALAVINEMTENALIKNYAIGGGIAAIFYIEPILTYDLDIFFIPGNGNDGLLVLAPLYDFLKRRGYLPEKEHIVIEGIPVQFLPVYNELIVEAVENAEITPYKSIKTRVIKAEYLIAIMLQTNRAKDKERVMKFIEDAEVDKELLETILIKFNLKEKFENLMRLYNEC
ncbi:MAG: hypothetical protein ACM3SY_03025 [Candidatus Omnitrophota bacterium]